MGDRLTGLPGRELLDDLRGRFPPPGTEEQWTAVMIDVDHFKLLNDTYGHLLGDTFLAEIGAVLRKNTRFGDAVIRYGGDEFLAILPLTSVRGAQVFAQRISDAVSSLTLPHALRPTLSIGIAERMSGDASLDDVIARADAALYQAKHEGRRRIVVFDPRASAQPPEAWCECLVGRERELRALRQVLEEALAKGMRLAVVAGEVGVGKTRLVEELGTYAVFRGCTVRWVACVEGGYAQPYSYLIDPLRGTMAQMAPHEIEQVCRVAGPVHPSLAGMVPGLAVREADDRFFGEEGLKFKVFDDIARVLQAVAVLRPLMVVIENAHWMARHDFELLSYLIRMGYEIPLLLLATLRTGGDDGAGCGQALLGLAHEGPSLVVRLGNLDREEVTALVVSALRDPLVPFDVLGMLYRQSGGNPLFLRELLGALKEEGRIARGTDGGWEYKVEAEPILPGSLGQIVARRVALLSGPTQSLLRAASLVRGPFSVALLAEATGRPELEVATGLEEALRAGAIAECKDTPEPSYRFVHDVVRAYLEGSMPRATKSLLHARMGEYCERLVARGREDMVAAAAHHFRQSGDAAKASEWALRAARAAAGRQAARETLDWIARYLERVDEGAAPREDLLWAYRVRGEFLSLTGAGAEAEASLSRALGLASTDAERAAVLTILADNSQKLSRYAEARARYEEALRLSTEPVGHADLLLSLVYLDHLEGSYGEALSRLEAARSLLESAPGAPGADHVWAAYHKRMGDVHHALGDTQVALRHYEASLARYQALGDKVGESAVINNMSSCYTDVGDSEKTLELLHQAARLNAQLDDALGLAIAHYNIAETYTSLNQGRLAREYYRRYMEQNARIGNEVGQGYGHLGLGHLAWLENDLEGAEAGFRAALDVFRRVGVGRLEVAALLLLGEVLFEKGEWAQGNQVVQELETLVPEGDEERHVGLPSLRALSLLFAPGGVGDEAERISTASRFLEEALRNLRPGDLGRLMGCAYYLAEARRRSHEPTQALHVLEAALATLSESLSRLSNLAYRESLLQARHVRRVREAYDRLAGVRWEPGGSG